MENKLITGSQWRVAGLYAKSLKTTDHRKGSIEHRVGGGGDSMVGNNGHVENAVMRGGHRDSSICARRRRRGWEGVQLCQWNIDGVMSSSIGNKLQDRNVVAVLQQQDIIGLTETHCSKSDNIQLEGYTTSIANRERHPNGRKDSGGVAVLIRNSLRHCTSIVPSASTDVMWVKMKKECMRLESDIFVGFVYISPDSSSFAKRQSDDVWGILYQEVSKFQSMGQVVLLGDFNARTGVDLDYIPDEDERHVQLPSSYRVDPPIHGRLSEDSKAKGSGSLLNDLCISASMRILNGRTMGDVFGKYTCHKYNGSSVIDYGIVQSSLWESVESFCVEQFMEVVSDHCPIHMKIRAWTHSDIPTVSFQHPCPRKPKWNDEIRKTYIDTVSTESFRSRIQSFTNEKLSDSTLDSHISKVTQALLIAAGAKPVDRMRKSPARKVSRDKKWFTDSCRDLRKYVVRLGQDLLKRPSDGSIRIAFFSAKKQFKKLARKEKRQFKQDIISQLEQLEEKNPQVYWKLVEDLKSMEQTDGTSSNNGVEADMLDSHYKTLLKTEVEWQDNEKTKTIENLITPFFNELNFKVSIAEIEKCIAKIKVGKAVGIDRVSGEMIKASGHVMTGWYQRLFNYILVEGIYPGVWGVGMIHSIFKAGSRADPNNYRGITVMSCVAKLFSMVLNERLSAFLDKNHVLCQQQIGFKKKARTTDHIFVLRTLIDKFRSSKKFKNLFLCFVDFKKAYDSVWHRGLIYKLLANNIGGQFAKVIEAMYQKIQAQVRLEGSMGEPFSCNIGVRQGDVLSPTLFNLYVNDIPEALPTDEHSPEIGPHKVNCLMYADDLVLISGSATGLQRHLDQLASYCNEWCLNVNTSKTKVMVISRNGHKKAEKFNLGGQELELVMEYKYLGVLMHASGSMRPAQQNIRHRALKALFKLRQLIRGVNVSPGLCLKLFDKLIKPICMYGCEIWANNSLMKTKSSLHQFWGSMEQFPVEKIHLSFCKYILGVHRKAVNAAVRGETGRYPLGVDMMVQMGKYIDHIRGPEYENSLLREAFIESKRIHDKGGQSWVSFLTNSLKLHNISLDQYLDWGKLGYKRFKGALIKSYQEKWQEEVRGDGVNEDKGVGKLATYRKLKQSLHCEKYLADVQNRSQRVAMSKFRISAHRLEVEVGRHTSPITPREQRFCKACKARNVMVLGDEFHCLMICPKYEDTRENVMKRVNAMCPQFKKLKDQQKFLFLMTAEGQYARMAAELCDNILRGR